MAKRIVLREGIIRYKHSGKFILISRVANHVIADKKPMHDINIPDTLIQGCGHRVRRGRNCTSVADILFLLEPSLSSSVYSPQPDGNGNTFTSISPNTSQSWIN